MAKWQISMHIDRIVKKCSDKLTIIWAKNNPIESNLSPRVSYQSSFHSTAKREMVSVDAYTSILNKQLTDLQKRSSSSEQSTRTGIRWQEASHKQRSEHRMILYGRQANKSLGNNIDSSLLPRLDESPRTCPQLRCHPLN